MCTIDSDNWRKSADWNTCKREEEDNQLAIKEGMWRSIKEVGKNDSFKISKPSSRKYRKVSNK